MKLRPQFHFSAAIATMLFAALLLALLVAILKDFATYSTTFSGYGIWIFYYSTLVGCFGVFAEQYVRSREKRKKNSKP